MTRFISHTFLFAIISLVTATLLAPASATACEEEATVILTSPNAIIEVLNDPDAVTARAWFEWMHRIERIMPKGRNLHADGWGEITLCRPSKDNEEKPQVCQYISEDYQGTGPEEVFHTLAKVTETPQSTLDTLVQESFPIWTIQVAATPFLEGALGVATNPALEQGDMHLSHRYREGGLLITPKDDSSLTYRVIAGIYPSKTKAKEALDALANTHNISGYIRKL